MLVALITALHLLLALGLIGLILLHRGQGGGVRQGPIEQAGQEPNPLFFLIGPVIDQEAGRVKLGSACSVTLMSRLKTSDGTFIECALTLTPER